MSKAKCTLCGDVMESTHRHDFVKCKCGASFLDGGDVYFRCGWDPARGAEPPVLVPDKPEPKKDT